MLDVILSSVKRFLYKVEDRKICSPFTANLKKACGYLATERDLGRSGNITCCLAAQRGL